MYHPKIHILAKNLILLEYVDALSFSPKKYIIKKQIPRADLDINKRRSYLIINIKEI